MFFDSYFIPSSLPYRFVCLLCVWKWLRDTVGDKSTYAYSLRKENLIAVCIQIGFSVVVGIVVGSTSYTFCTKWNLIHKILSNVSTLVASTSWIRFLLVCRVKSGFIFITSGNYSGSTHGLNFVWTKFIWRFRCNKNHQFLQHPKMVKSCMCFFKWHTRKIE